MGMATFLLNPSGCGLASLSISPFPSRFSRPSAVATRLRLESQAVPSSPLPTCVCRAQINANRENLSLSLPSLTTLGKNIQQNLSKFWDENSGLAIHLAALVATVSAEQPALAVTGVNDEEDLVWVLIQLGIVVVLYFLIFPPIIMNWLRIRWYRRNVLEMYVQFMFVFLFFPGLLLWAPFLNFRKFPRDPSMKYPWSVPEDPSQVKNSYLKYPFAEPEDYD